MRLFLIAAAIGLAACGSGDEGGEAVSSESAAAPAANASYRTEAPRGLKGSLYLELNEPLDPVQVMKLDMRSGKYGIAANGSEPDSWGKDMVFLEPCSPLYLRVSLTDPDGFAIPISECTELDTISPDILQPRIHPDGKYIAVTMTAVAPPPTGDYMEDLTRQYDTYPAVFVYDREGEKLAELKGFGASAWTREGELIVSGAGEDPGPGIYKVSKDFRTADRIDDGRLNSAIGAMDAHPKKDWIAFVYNGQLWEMDLADGAPKRIHSHGLGLDGIAYSPDGTKIAFVSDDPLDEAMKLGGGGYRIYVYDGGDVQDIVLPFIPGGPLAWVD